MKKIFESTSELETFLKSNSQHDPNLWTAIIPAAGRGSRMKGEIPKILYPFSGRPLIEWPMLTLSPICQYFVFVLSPLNYQSVIPYLEKNLKGRYAIAFQKEPLGMGHAVFCAEKLVLTPNCLVMWADQVALKTQTILNCMKVHTTNPHTRLTLPTVVKHNSYIHIERDGQKRICKILHQREGDQLPSTAESDCGVFLFNSKVLFHHLEKYQKDPLLYGKRTQEFNLLPLLPYFEEQEEKSVITLRIAAEVESLGINTQEDAATLKNLMN